MRGDREEEVSWQKSEFRGKRGREWKFGNFFREGIASVVTSFAKTEDESLKDLNRLSIPLISANHEESDAVY